MKPMREETWLHGIAVPDKAAVESRAKAFFMITPSDECMAEFTAYISGARRTPVKEDAPAAPTKSALEMGENNETFKVPAKTTPLP
jgi:hypothetical protein